MPVLEFQLIPSYDKESFRSVFTEYLEEVDLLLGRPINPDIMQRYPDYVKYFRDDPTHQPFRIAYVDHDPKTFREIRVSVGFFFLKLLTTKDFPKEIKSILTDKQPIANLTEFYLFKSNRKQGLAWEFYYSIIRLCKENEWYVCWECDKENTPAIGFYTKILERIKKEFPFEATIGEYKNPQSNNRIFYFYQVKFV